AWYDVRNSSEETWTRVESPGAGHDRARTPRRPAAALRVLGTCVVSRSADSRTRRLNGESTMSRRRPVHALPTSDLHRVLAMPSTIWTVLSRTRATILRPASVAAAAPPEPPAPRRSLPACTDSAPCHLGRGQFALWRSRHMRNA